jgi:hypothetical protein
MPSPITLIFQGGHIVLAGIVFQLGNNFPLNESLLSNKCVAVIITYSLCKTEFIFRYRHDAPVRRVNGTVPLRKGQVEPGIKIMLLALGFNTLCLVTR